MKKIISSTYVKGKKVYLRQMTIDDAKTIVEWRNDPEIQKWMFTQDKLTLEKHLDWFKNRKNRIDFIICDLESGKAIGTVNFINIQEKRAEAGKMLGDKNFWGGGFAKEAFILWLNIGFIDFHFEEIYVKTMSHNLPNIGLNKKLGFTKKESHTKMINSNQEVEILVMNMKKNEFKYLV